MILGSGADLLALGLLAQGGGALALRVEAGARSLPFRVAWFWNARFSLAVGRPDSAVVYGVARLL